MLSFPRIHRLKILDEYFTKVLRKDKPFEVRKNDRDFHIGDWLLMDEISKNTLEYTGRQCVCEVTYVLKDCPEYGVMPGFAVLGIKLQDSFWLDTVNELWAKQQ